MNTLNSRNSWMLKCQNDMWIFRLCKFFQFNYSFKNLIIVQNSKLKNQNDELKFNKEKLFERIHYLPLLPICYRAKLKYRKGFFMDWNWIGNRTKLISLQTYSANGYFHMYPCACMSL